jgi:tetratricopeptide (TPR) repeat protein
MLLGPRILFLLLLCTGVMGCASAPVKETPKEIVPAPEERFAMDSLARARELEAADKLPEALRQYKIVLTIRPNYRAAEEGRDRVEKVLRKSADEHYRAGLRMQKEGKQSQALQQFLTALRLWPDYPEALQQLAVVRPSVPAEKQMVQKPQREPEPKEPPKELSVEEGARVSFDQLPLQEEPREVVDQVAVYREHGMELYWEGRRQEALSEFSKVLSAKPNDPVAKEYSYKSSFELALEFFQKKDYLAAKEQFLVSLKHNSNCQQCHVYIRRSEELFKELHYKQGIEYYGKEQLTEAILEWELVRSLDPNYKRVDYYIKKAKELQRKIDELKKESKEEAQE